MKRALMFLITAAASVSASATPGWMSATTISRIFNSGGYLYIAPTAALPSDACSLYGSYFKIDYRDDSTVNPPLVVSAEKKAMLAMLMMAKADGRSVELWYTPSSTPGTTEQNGCSTASMSTLTGVSMPTNY